MSASRKTSSFRVYVDTSVFGGCFDRAFSAESRRFFDLVREGRVQVLVSAVVIRELSLAPAQVRGVFESLPTQRMQVVELDPAVLDLRDAYLEAHIVDKRSIDDATVARADAIVSWNFRHIVRLDKMRAYNQVNLTHGYGLLSIVSPQEVRFDDQE